MNSEATITPIEYKPRLGWLLTIGMVLALLVSMFLSFYSEWLKTGNISAACGSAGGVCFCALIVILVFSISPRFRSPRFRAKIVLWTSIICILSCLGNISTNKVRAVEKIANEINATCPKMINAATRVEGAAAGPGLLLTIRETFVGIDGKSMNRNEWETKFAPKLRKNIANNPGMRKIISSGIVVVYRFSGRDGALVDEMQLTKQDIQNE